MAPWSCTTCHSPCVNTAVDPAGNLDKLIATQGPARKSNVGSNKATIKFYTPHETFTPLFVSPLIKNLLTKFMKVFMKMTQIWDQE